MDSLGLRSVLDALQRHEERLGENRGWAHPSTYTGGNETPHLGQDSEALCWNPCESSRSQFTPDQQQQGRATPWSTVMDVHWYRHRARGLMLAQSHGDLEQFATIGTPQTPANQLGSQEIYVGANALEVLCLQVSQLVRTQGQASFLLLVDWSSSVPWNGFLLGRSWHHSWDSSFVQSVDCHTWSSRESIAPAGAGRTHTLEQQFQDGMTPGQWTIQLCVMICHSSTEYHHHHLSGEVLIADPKHFLIRPVQNNGIPLNAQIPRTPTTNSSNCRHVRTHLRVCDVLIHLMNLEWWFQLLQAKIDKRW